MVDDPLDPLRARFREGGARTAARIRSHLAGQPDPELGRLVHGLAGAAGMFGHPELGEAARAADEAFEAGRQPAPETLADLADRLERLSPLT